MLGSLPMSLELGQRNGYGGREKLSPLSLLAEPYTEQLPEVIAPMRAIVPQHISVGKYLDLPHRVLIVPHLEEASKGTPGQTGGFGPDAKSHCLEVEHCPRPPIT